jgi:universal stress protein A
VDVNYSDLYTGLIDVNLGDMQKRISEETHHALTELSTNAGYPITETLSGSGDLGQVLVDAIKKYDMDLVVCGHHQDFWSKLMSSAPADQHRSCRHADRPAARRRRRITVPFYPRNTPADAGVFIFAFPRHAAELQSIKSPFN